MMEISLCMIVKNESEVLERCLDSISDLVEEIIIVDTGSTDNTKEIAYKYTDLVYDFEWVDDFAAARNFAFSKATKDYIYSADADEVLDSLNRKRFRDLKQVLLSEIEIVQMYYLTDMRYNTTENYIRDLRPKLYKRLRTFSWINPIHETVRTEPVVYNSDIEILHMPTSNHCSRDFEIFKRLIAKDKELNHKLHMMYARELYKSASDEELLKSKEYFEYMLNKAIMTNDDYIRAHESIAVLSKIYCKEEDNRGLVTLLRYLVGELSFSETKCAVYREYDEDMKLIEGILDVENELVYKSNLNVNLSSELTMHIGIRLMEEDCLEESRKWFVRTTNKTRSVIDIDSCSKLPNNYLEIIDSKKLLKV